MIRFFSTVCFLLITSVSFAAEKTAAQKLDAETVALFKRLDDNQQKQFAAIRSSHGILKAVENTGKTMSLGVASCSENNPDMAAAIETGFANWRNYLQPVMDQGQSKLNEMIKLQTFYKPEKLRTYLKRLDKVVEAEDKKITKIPVQSEKECEDLLEKIEDSRGKLRRLLIETLRLDKLILQK